MALGGSGFGKFKRGSRITSFKGIRQGTVLLHHTPQFHARNVVKITNSYPHGKRNRDIVYGIFVKPTNTKEKRLGDDQEHAIWDFNLKRDRYYRAR